jgi:hypothetical protein
MSKQVGGFVFVVQVADRSSNSVAVFEQVPHDVVPNVAVGTGDKDTAFPSVRHMAWEVRDLYQPSSATSHTVKRSQCRFVSTTPVAERKWISPLSNQGKYRCMFVALLFTTGVISVMLDVIWPLI